MKLIPLRSPGIKLALLSLMHFATDGLCAFLVFAKLYPENPALAVLVFFGYNILAFVTQSPVGLLIDKYNKPKLFLAISVLSMLIGYLFSSVWFLSVFFIGVSNSIFHVAGGKYVSDKSGNDISHLGIFVSTGAIGLVLGQRYLSFTPMPYLFFVLLIIPCVIMLILEDSETKIYPEEYDYPDSSTYALLAVIAVVAIRAFVGKVVSPDFTPSGQDFLLISFATAFGKAMGGICSKAFGIKWTTYISMTVAALCMTLGTSSMPLFILGIFAFNFTMPITLYYANVILKGHEGFAFGTLAAALTPGFFIAMAFTYSIAIRICAAALCVVSMVVIILVSKRVKKDVRGINTYDNP